MSVKISAIWDLGKDLIKRAGDADISGLAGEMAFRLLFAMFPFLLFLVALASFFGTEEMVVAVADWMQRTMPPQAAALLEEPVRRILTGQQGGILSISAITALWGASGVMSTVMKGLNRTHRVTDNRSFLVKNLVKVGLTLFLAVIFLVAATAVIGAQVVIGSLGLFNLGPEMAALARILGPLLALAILIFGVAVIYWKAPALEEHSFKLLSAGAIMFGVGWVVGAILLSWYISNFGNYNKIYGSIAGVIVLLTWAYWSSFILLLGATVNAVLEEREGARAPMERHPEEHHGNLQTQSNIGAQARG